MKKVLMAIVFMGVAGVGHTGNASTDWTSFLQPMTNNCGYVDMDTIPKSLKSSIVSKKVKVDKSSDISDITTTTFTLKNATAFGYALTKIEKDTSMMGGGVTLYFANNDFIKLRSKFATTPNAENDEEAVEPVFNQKKKSISCSVFS